jgi:hypothetical protein
MTSKPQVYDKKLEKNLILLTCFTRNERFVEFETFDTDTSNMCSYETYLKHLMGGGRRKETEREQKCLRS